jgi:hypothetical protein
VYIESRAYVSNLRQKLVCGSPLLAPRLHHYEWYSRALVPGTHFVQVAIANMTAVHIAATSGWVGGFYLTHAAVVCGQHSTLAAQV